MLPMKNIGLLLVLVLVASGLAATTPELDATPAASRLTEFTVSGLATATPELDVTPAASRPTGFTVSAAVTKTVVFDVTQGQIGYTRFMTQVLYTEVLRTTAGRVQDRPQLGKQKLSTQPDTWVHAVLKAGAQTATLALRADNLYLAGFKAQDGVWHGFKGALLPGAISLSFGDDYRSLIGGSYKKMVNVVVGRSATLAAVSTLARYRVGGPVSEDEVRQALATMVLTFCEAQRFTVVLKSVTTAWDNGGHVSQAGIDLLIKWKDVSCALIGYNNQKIKNWSIIPETKKIKGFGDPKMEDKKAAVENIIFVLMATKCDD